MEIRHPIEAVLQRAARQNTVILANPEDPLDPLLARAQQWPLLEPHEEIDLAKRIEKGDLDAKERLINSNLRLVVHMAGKKQGQGLPKEDLVQDGMIGLIRAAEKFDWRKGYRFTTYATIWIRQSTQRGLDNTGRLIRIPVNVEQDIRKVRDVESDLVSLLGREPSLAEIAEVVKFDLEYVTEIRQLIMEPLSLDKVIKEDEATVTTLGDFVSDDTDYAAKTAAEMDAKAQPKLPDLNQELHKAVETLQPKERRVIKILWGIGSEKRNLGWLSRNMQLDPEEVSNLEARALKQLRKKVGYLAVFAED